jgi:hypothetical protein
MFKNLSCYEEFEIQATLTCISKIDVLKEIGHKINDYYFFVSYDGIFNWFDLNGNHVKDPGILKEIEQEHIPDNIIKCIIPNSVISIRAETFLGCESLKEIIIPESVTSIGDYAFYDCGLLTLITIPNNVICIGDDAFTYCESLKEIIIPDSVTNIGYDTFNWCDSLKEVIFKGKTLDEVKQMENYPFGIKDESIFNFS